MAGYQNIQHAVLSDVGVRRSQNEDNHAALLATDPAQWQDRGHFFLIADGMGGHAVGELASKLAVDIIPHTYSKYAQEGPALALRKAFLEANLSIHARGQQNPDFKDMGTTGTALLVRPEGAWVGHVGDSRAYRIRDGYIEQLSFDHSVQWELARHRHINPEKLQGLRSNVILRALGPQPLVQVDIEGPHPLLPGDIFLLCSDGLTGPVSDHEIGAVASVLPPEEACRFLVDLANLRGGPDNITVLIIRVEGEGTGSPALAPARPARPPWYQRLPWPLAALVLGVLLGTGAAALTYLNLWGGVPAFLLAAIALAAGLVGLMIDHQQAKRHAKDEPDAPEIHVYSHAKCNIERVLVDKLLKAEGVLEQRARDKQWEVDWAAYQHHHQLAEQALAQGQLVESFREHCRALDVLIDCCVKNHHKDECFLKHHSSEEFFQPVSGKSAAKEDPDPAGEPTEPSQGWHSGPGGA